jgi:hypothetical protein
MKVTDFFEKSKPAGPTTKNKKQQATKTRKHTA